MCSKRKAVSEYEKIRLKNIEDNKAFLAELMRDMKDIVGSPVKQRRQVKRRSYAERCHLPLRRNPQRSCRPDSLQHSGSGSTSPASSLSSPARDGHLVVKFGSFTKSRRPSSYDDEDDCDDDIDDNVDEDYEQPRRKRRRVTSTNLVVRRDISSVTEDDLKRVAEHVCEKRYDSNFGSTCHQCRQKTDDMKTICTSSECAGVRGQFCGPCLRNRYGEEAKEALRNAEWLCPPCRGICNCSFCRRDAGKASTGILIHLARQAGYNDVNSYLQSLRRK